MKKHTKTFWAYLAGIIDGEGTISLCNLDYSQSYGTGYIGTLQVASTNKQLTEWIKKNCGGRIKIDTRKAGLNHKPGHHWIALACDTCYILEQVMPYLIIKKKHAKILIAYRKTVQNNRQVTVSTRKKRDSMVTQLKKLNKKGIF